MDPCARCATRTRDAAFTVYALLRIGFTEEANAFMSFREARCREALRFALERRRGPRFFPLTGRWRRALPVVSVR
jgi:hypothetical protein